MMISTNVYQKSYTLRNFTKNILSINKINNHRQVSTRSVITCTDCNYTLKIC